MLVPLQTSLLVNSSRRPTEATVENMVRESMVHMDKAAHGGAGSSDVLQAMVTASGEEAFSEGTMLLSDVTTLTPETKISSDIQGATQPADSEGGGQESSDKASSKSEGSGKSKQLWFDRDSSINAARRALRHSFKTLQGTASSV